MKSNTDIASSTHSRILLMPLALIITAAWHVLPIQMSRDAT